MTDNVEKQLIHLLDIFVIYGTIFCLDTVTGHYHSLMSLSLRTWNEIFLLLFKQRE